MAARMGPPPIDHAGRSTADLNPATPKLSTYFWRPSSCPDQSGPRFARIWTRGRKISDPGLTKGFAASECFSGVAGVCSSREKLMTPCPRLRARVDHCGAAEWHPREGARGRARIRTLADSVASFAPLRARRVRGPPEAGRG